MTRRAVTVVGEQRPDRGSSCLIAIDDLATADPLVRSTPETLS